MATTTVFAERGTPLWDRVWALLAGDVGGDTAQECACCGERWQYMGTYVEHGKSAHEFRHRHSPGTGNREYRRFIEDTAAGTTTQATAIVYPPRTGAAHELRPLLAQLSEETVALLRAVVPGLGE